jgi:hypothetical protein
VGSGTVTIWIKGKSMHFEILVEDISGKIALDILIPKVIDSDQHTFDFKSYKGIGHIPKNLKSSSDPKHRILLDQLPRLVKGYGNSFSKYPPEYSAVLVIVCDLDSRCLHTFRRELFDIIKKCNSVPKILFCIAIEEGEAWYLGDIEAIKSAYPNAKSPILNAYENDAICGTWETLADALFPGGCKSLSKKGWQAIGKEKATWAEKISPCMNVEQNLSPSFCYFRDKLRSLVP